VKVNTFSQPTIDLLA